MFIYYIATITEQGLRQTHEPRPMATLPLLSIPGPSVFVLDERKLTDKAW